MTDEEVRQTLLTNATKPAKVSGDTGSAEQHNILDVARALKEMPSSAAAAKPARGMRFTKMVPPGAP